MLSASFRSSSCTRGGDAALQPARAPVAEVLQEPIVQPWGPRDCAFRDPSGNMIRINQG